MFYPRHISCNILQVHTYKGDLVEGLGDLDPQEAWNELFGITPTPEEQTQVVEDMTFNKIVIGSVCGCGALIALVIVIVVVSDYH